MNYRPEIDGLRTIAVFSVIFYHADFEIFSGGFVGVDVFFVISGYLITNLIISDISKGNFKLLDFYNKRIRRIFPVLFFVTFCCIPFSWMYMFTGELKNFSQSLVAVGAFASNILFWQESSYFAASAEEKPLLHTWSLAVEEQFYLLFPIVLIMLAQNKRHLLIVCILLSIGSLGISNWLIKTDSVANFYLLPSRLWELLAGSVAAIILSSWSIKSNSFLSLTGLLCIIFSISFIEHNTVFSSYYVFLPIIGTMLIILFSANSFTAKILSNALLVRFGLMSFSLYLWHQPLFAFAKIYFFEEPTKALKVALILLTVLLSVLTFKFIEKPFRDKKLVSSKTMFSLYILGTISLLFVGLLGNKYAAEFSSGRFHPHSSLRELNIGNYSYNNRYFQQQSWNLLRKRAGNDSYGVDKNKFDEELWYDLNSSKSNILLVGNSHSKDLFNIFTQSVNVMSKFQIARYGTQIKDLISEDLFWQSPNYQHSSKIVIVSKYTDLDLAHLPGIIKKVRADNKKIFIVKNIFEFPGPASGFGPNLIDDVISKSSIGNVQYLSSEVNKEYYNYRQNDIENRSYEINYQLEKLAEEESVTLLDRMDYICRNDMKICQAVQKDLTKNFYDYGHHTLDGARFFANSNAFQKFLSPIISAAEL